MRRSAILIMALLVGCPADGGDSCPGPDSDGDGVADSCDVCAIGSDNLDADQDTVPDACDACPGFSDLIDSDGDGVADGCDVCAGFDDDIDLDGNGTPDGCEMLDMGVTDLGPPDAGRPDLGPPDLGPPDLGVDFGPPDFGPPDCSAAMTATPTVYYVDSLTIPSSGLAHMGGVVGFDLDGRDGACGLDDWAFDVDNAFIDLNEASPSLRGDIDFQREITEGLCSPDPGMVPAGFAVDIEVRLASDCALITIKDGIGGDTLAGPFPASFSGGVLSNATTPALTLTFPYTHGGQSVGFALAMQDVHFRARLGASGLENIILGGTVPATALEPVVMNWLPVINAPSCGAGGQDCIAFSSVAGILAGLYDTPGPTGACGTSGGLSVGLLGTADTNPTPPACALD